MPRSGRQDLNTLRLNIENVHNSIRNIHNLDTHFVTDEKIFRYIQFLEASRRRLTLHSQTIEQSGGEVPLNVIEALQAAEVELRNVVQGYEQRNALMTKVMGGRDKVQEIKRLKVGRNPTKRIQRYLHTYPNIPGGVEDYLLENDYEFINIQPLYARGSLNAFPNWASDLNGTKAQRNPQDTNLDTSEARYTQKPFMMKRLIYWLTNREMYRGSELQKLRNDRAQSLMKEYRGSILPEGLLLNEPFLYLANVDRTFEEPRPYIDRTLGIALSEQQLRSRLQLINTKSKLKTIINRA